MSMYHRFIRPKCAFLKNEFRARVHWIESLTASGRSVATAWMRCLKICLNLRVLIHKSEPHPQVISVVSDYLFNPMNCSPPGSSVHRTLQARILKWVAMPSSRESSRPRDQTRVFRVSCIVVGGFFTSEPPGNAPTQGRYED